MESVVYTKIRKLITPYRLKTLILYTYSWSSVFFPHSVFHLSSVSGKFSLLPTHWAFSNLPWSPCCSFYPGSKTLRPSHLHCSYFRMRIANSLVLKHYWYPVTGRQWHRKERDETSQRQDKKVDSKVRHCICPSDWRLTVAYIYKCRGERGLWNVGGTVREGLSTDKKLVWREIPKDKPATNSTVGLPPGFTLVLFLFEDKHLLSDQ